MAGDGIRVQLYHPVYGGQRWDAEHHLFSIPQLELDAMLSRFWWNPERIHGPDDEYVQLYRDRHSFLHGAIGRQHSNPHWNGNRDGEWNDAFGWLGNRHLGPGRRQGIRCGD